MYGLNAFLTGVLLVFGWRPGPQRHDAGEAIAGYWRQVGGYFPIIRATPPRVRRAGHPCASQHGQVEKYGRNDT